MVVFQRRLERRSLVVAAANRVGRFVLLVTVGAHVVAHQAVGFFRLLLAAPYSVGNHAQGTEQDGTANANNHTYDSIARLGGHARGGTVLVRVQTGRWCRLGGAGRGRSARRRDEAGVGRLGSRFLLRRSRLLCRLRRGLRRGLLRGSWHGGARWGSLRGRGRGGGS